MLEELKAQLKAVLKPTCDLRKGLSTGSPSLDEKLPWQGLPREGLSAFIGEAGSGRTRLWASALAHLHKQSPNSEHLSSGLAAKEDRTGWGIFIENPEGQLYPPGLAQMGVDLGRLLLIRAPRAGELQKLSNECRSSGCSVVLFFDKPPESLSHWLFKLRLSFTHPEFYMIEKAQVATRSSPHALPGGRPGERTAKTAHRRRHCFPDFGR